MPARCISPAYPIYINVAALANTDSMAVEAESQQLQAARQIARRNPLKEKLIKGQLAHALSVKLVSSIEIIGYASAVGYDSVLIDLEHSPFGLETTNQLCCAALANE